MILVIHVSVVLLHNIELPVSERLRAKPNLPPTTCGRYRQGSLHQHIARTIFYRDCDL